MTRSRGICLISVPKSGTMFVSRYLERSTGARTVFGLEGYHAAALMDQLQCGWHPEVAQAAIQGSHDLITMTRRFAQMLARNRREAQTSPGPVIYSDHGLHSFLSFLIHPQPSDVQDPAQVCAWARERQLSPVFLYRDIRSVANSLAHFLAARKSFLVGLRSLPEACELVTRLHAPVLAQQIRCWRAQASALGVLWVSYEDLMANPQQGLRAICEHGAIAWSRAAAADSPHDYRSWTYRRQGGGWIDTFTTNQQDALNALATSA